MKFSKNICIGSHFSRVVDLWLASLLKCVPSQGSYKEISQTLKVPIFRKTLKWLPPLWQCRKSG